MRHAAADAKPESKWKLLYDTDDQRISLSQFSLKQSTHGNRLLSSDS